MRYRLRHLVLLAIILGVATGYALIWRHMSGRAQAEVERFIADRRALGEDIAHGPLRMGGFPFRIEVEVPAPAWAERPGGHALRWQADRLVAYAQPWNLRHFIFDMSGHHRLHWQDQGRPREAVLDSPSARGSLVFDRAGRPERGAADLRDVRLLFDAQPYGAERLDIHARVSPEPSRKGAPEIALSARNLTLPPALATAFGNPVEQATVAAAAIGAGPDMPAGRSPAEALARWRDTGGVIEIDNLDLRDKRWTIKASGTLTLDAEMRPLGAVGAQVTGFAVLVDGAVRAGWLGGREAQAAKFALQVLSKENADGRAQVSVPLTAQDGRLYVGPVAVARLAPILSAPAGAGGK